MGPLRPPKPVPDHSHEQFGSSQVQGWVFRFLWRRLDDGTDDWSSAVDELARATAAGSLASLLEPLSCTQLIGFSGIVKLGKCARGKRVEGAEGRKTLQPRNLLHQPSCELKLLNHLAQDYPPENTLVPFLLLAPTLGQCWLTKISLKFGWLSWPDPAPRR
jgi:hypothetical protein